MEKYFKVTNETEETGMWSGQYRTTYDDVTHIREIYRIQKIFNKYGIVPSYLVDYSIAIHKESSGIIRKIFEDGGCEIGAHMHPWCTPPFEEERTNRNSYFCNLDVRLQEKKLANLTETIKNNLGASPVVFRAGRFGFEDSQALLLHKLGYLVDSSVTPFMNWSDDDGPSFDDKLPAPYWIREGISLGTSPGILEIPVSVGFNNTNFERCHKIFKALENNRATKTLHIIGILDRLSLMEKIILTPEAQSLKKLKDLSRAFSKNKNPVLNMYFHSNSLKPGDNPYIRNEADLENFFKKLDSYFDYLCNELGFKNTTLAGYREILLKDKQ